VIIISLLNWVKEKIPYSFIWNISETAFHQWHKYPKYQVDPLWGYYQLNDQLVDAGA
jgi:hypothetical protein